MALIRCDFILTGYGYDPDAITQALAIEPTRTWRQGDAIARSGLHYKHDGWCLSNGPVEALDAQEVAQPLLAKLLPQADTIATLRVQWALDCEVAYTVHSEDAVPALHFDLAMVRALAQLHAEFDIDVYTSTVKADWLLPP